MKLDELKKSLDILNELKGSLDILNGILKTIKYDEHLL